MKVSVKMNLFLSLLTVYGLSAYAGTEQKRDETITTHQISADTQEKTDKSDAEHTRMIRKDLMNNKSLSTYGKNVSIITEGGKVILRDQVHSKAEGRKIFGIAQKVVGKNQVQNQLVVK